MDVDIPYVISELVQATPPNGTCDWETAMFIGYQAINGMLVLEEDVVHLELSFRAHQDWFHLKWPMNEFAQLRDLHHALDEIFPGSHRVVWMEGSPQTGDFRAVYREDGTVRLPSGQQCSVFPEGSDKIGRLIWDSPGEIYGGKALFERPHSNPGEGMCPVNQGFGISCRGLDVRCAQSLMAAEIFGDELLQVRRMVAERRLCKRKRVNWPLDERGRELFLRLGAGDRLDEADRQMFQEECKLEKAVLRA